MRQDVGYARLEGEEAVRVLKALYAPLCVYLNFFHSVMRCQQKVRDGSRVTRRHDTPQTPVQRLSASAGIPEEVGLRQQQSRFHLLRSRGCIDYLLAQLERLAVASSGRVHVH